MKESVYLQRYSYGPRLIKTTPASDLKIVVVIPCYFEPDLISTLQSLTRCAPPQCAVEVIVIVNDCDEDAAQVRELNRDTIKQANQWIVTQKSALSFYILHQILPKKHAGVGLARKIGMDEAVRRFSQLNRQGIIACLDADCTCSTNYLKALEDHFDSNKDTPGCSIYFEHALNGPLSPDIYQSISGYELHLRYYIHGLRYSQLPYAFQTVGSSMAVRSSAYVKQGGMNKRQAGEDFYFLQKIISLGGFTELPSATVFPSSRLSTRVPFGTGKAMVDAIKNPGVTRNTYNPKTFTDLKLLAQNVENLHQTSPSIINGILESFSSGFQEFITKEKFNNTIQELNQQTASFNSFRKRFFNKFDGFFAFKYANYVRSNCYESVEVTKAAAWLLNKAYGVETTSEDLKTLLMQFRLLDRK